MFLPPDRDSAQMKVRMTYCNMETEELRYFVSTHSRAELEEWFIGILEEYKKWADFSSEWQVEARTASIRALPSSRAGGGRELCHPCIPEHVHKRNCSLRSLPA